MQRPDSARERRGIRPRRRRFALVEAARGGGDAPGAGVGLPLLAVVDEAEHQHADRHHRHYDDHDEEDGEARAKAHDQARTLLRLPAIAGEFASSHACRDSRGHDGEQHFAEPEHHSAVRPRRRRCRKAPRPAVRSSPGPPPPRSRELGPVRWPQRSATPAELAGSRSALRSPCDEAAAGPGRAKLSRNRAASAAARGYSSVGRAPGSHPGGRRFESG